MLQNEDGGWGLHIESHSSMLCTVLNYVCLRMLGDGPEAEDSACARALKWILDHGGVTYVPSWGKIWLAVRLKCSSNPQFHLIPFFITKNCE